METKEKETKETKPETQEISSPKAEQIIIPTAMNSDELNPTSRKRDLSGIIPEFKGTSENDPMLESKETSLKADGAVVIGMYIEDTDQASYKEGVQLPEQIDIEARKKEIQANKNKKRKNKTPENGKKKKNKMSRSQNITALVALLVIGFLVYFYFEIYQKRPNENAFQARIVNVELGSKLPLRMIEYVIPGTGETINEIAYSKDMSKVVIDAVGEYDYTVTHNGITRQGKIIIQDTTPPIMEIRNVTIMEGETYTPEQFIQKCVDLNGCNYYFEDPHTTEKNKDPGTYSIYIVAEDSYGNKTIKQAPLIIEQEGMRIYFYRENAYNFEKNYEYIEEYELHFSENQLIDQATILNGEYKQYYYYKYFEDYQKDKEEYLGKLNYSFDDSKNLITITKVSNTVGYNYSEMSLVREYLNDEGFTQSYQSFIK